MRSNEGTHFLRKGLIIMLLYPIVSGICSNALFSQVQETHNALRAQQQLIAELNSLIPTPAIITPSSVSTSNANTSASTTLAEEDSESVHSAAPLHATTVMECVSLDDHTHASTSQARTLSLADTPTLEVFPSATSAPPAAAANSFFSRFLGAMTNEEESNSADSMSAWIGDTASDIPDSSNFAITPDMDASVTTPATENVAGVFGLGHMLGSGLKKLTG